MNYKAKKSIKWICVMVALLVFVLAGCSGVGVPATDNVMPWTEKGQKTTERTTYDFFRYLTSESFNPDSKTEDDSEEKGYLLNKSGTLSYEIIEGKTISAFVNTPIASVLSITPDQIEGMVADYSNHTLIKMIMTIDYKDDLSHISDNKTGEDLKRTLALRRVYESKSDQIVSFAVIDRYTLSSIFTYKYSNIAVSKYLDKKTGQELDTMSYTMLADYTGTVLGTAKAMISDNTDNYSLSIKKGQFFDSESVYFRIRAFSFLEDGGKTSFAMANPYDRAMDDKKSVKSFNAEVAVEKDTAKIPLNPLLYSYFDVNTDMEDSTTEPQNALDCYKTVLALTAQKKGHNINLYYSANPLKVNYALGCYVAAKKVLVKIEYPNHDKATNSIYNQEFVLKSFNL